MPNHQERGQLGGQPGQPVQLANDVAITRSWPIPAVRPPDPTTMAKAGLRHGYVTRAGRVVKPEHYTYLYTVKYSVKKKNN